MTDRNRIENEGSTARDHLANERTFLAWVRTALGLMGLGVLFERLVVERPSLPSTVIALATVASGALMLVYAARRYDIVAKALPRRQYVVASISPVVVGGVAAVLTLVIAWWMLLS